MQTLIASVHISIEINYSASLHMWRAMNRHSCFASKMKKNSWMRRRVKKKHHDDEDLDEIEKHYRVKKPKSVKRKRSFRIPAKKKEVKIVKNFNLLLIPKNVNLKPLFQEFVNPMIPVGYKIQFKTKKFSSTASQIECMQFTIFFIKHDSHVTCF